MAKGPRPGDGPVAASEGRRVGMLVAEAQEALAHARSEEAVLRIVADHACRMLQARLTAVWTPDMYGWLVPRATAGAAEEYAQGLKLSVRKDRPSGAGMAGVAFREGRIIALNTEGAPPPGMLPQRWEAWRRRAAVHGFRQVLILPLRYRGTSLGLLNCYLAGSGPPPPAAWEAVRGLAITATAALHGMYLREETMLTLAAAREARDAETLEHALRVSLYAERLAEELGVLDPEQLERIRWGALLHDVGKIGLPDEVLKQAGKLNAAAWRVVRRHPGTGYELIRRLEFLGEARQVVLAHHERFDGTGYPRGLRGEAIPLGARIFAVVDTLDAITSDRPYRPAADYLRAAAEIRQGAGTQLDPAAGAAFERIREEQWTRLRRRARQGFFSRLRPRRCR